ncbi:MAG: HypC/HybG/HupF family hydrogenase formation chaperone [Deltaproteobacteria bacterium]|nr:HypC/HybG/HupF family hydrogenase formation chaperone [Deltaproteobacteria bacterium]
MCISFPGKIIAFNEEESLALIEIGSTRREVSMDLLDEAPNLGDYLLCHAGFAIHRLDADEAETSLKVLQEIIDNEIY